MHGDLASVSVMMRQSACSPDVTQRLKCGQISSIRAHSQST